MMKVLCRMEGIDERLVERDSRVMRDGMEVAVWRAEALRCRVELQPGNRVARLRTPQANL